MSDKISSDGSEVQKRPLRSRWIRVLLEVVMVLLSMLLMLTLLFGALNRVWDWSLSLMVATLIALTCGLGYLHVRLFPVESQPEEVYLRLSDVLSSIKRQADNYPADVFPDSGTSKECNAAKLVRSACKNIEDEVTALAGNKDKARWL